MMDMDVVLDGIFHQNGTYDYDETYEYKDDPVPEHSSGVWILVLYSAVLLVGLLGNGLLLAVLALKRRSWTISDTFVLYLSVADVPLLVMLPFRAAQATQNCEWCFKEVLCKISGAVFNISFYFGIFLLVCITLDRYLSIIRATQFYSLRKPWLAHICCLLLWLSSLILAIPDWIFMVAWKDPAREKTLCVHKYSQSTTDWLLVSRLLHHILGFLLPAASLIFCCSSIMLQLQCIKSIRVILSLVVLFFLCWLPYNITLVVDTVGRSRSKELNDGLSGNPEGSLKTALMVSSTLGCIHACLRPLLYLGLCANFRKRAVAMLRCATVESESSLWEFGMGEEAPTDPSQELEQMTSVNHQMQSTQW